MLGFTKSTDAWETCGNRGMSLHLPPDNPEQRLCPRTSPREKGAQLQVRLGTWGLLRVAVLLATPRGSFLRFWSSCLAGIPSRGGWQELLS